MTQKLENRKLVFWGNRGSVLTNQKFLGRDSSIELLRIFLMLLIVLSHYGIHGISIPNNVFSVQNVLVSEICCYGTFCDGCFFVISGYFQFQGKKPSVKKVVSLCLELVFYSLLWFSIISLSEPSSFSFSFLIKSFFPLFYFYWFMGCWLLIYICSPLLNRSVASFSQKQFRFFLGFGFFVLLFLGVFIDNIWVTFFGDLPILALYYFLGAYFRKFDIRFSKKWLWILLVTFLVGALSIPVVEIVNDHFSLNINFYRALHYSSPLSFLLAGSVFLLFKAIPLKRNIGINLFSSSVFGIYLLHDNDFARSFFWNNICQCNQYIGSPYLFLHMFICVFWIMIFGFVIDILRKWLFEKPLLLLINKPLSFLESKVDLLT